MSLPLLSCRWALCKDSRFTQLPWTVLLQISSLLFLSSMWKGAFISAGYEMGTVCVCSSILLFFVRVETLLIYSITIRKANTVTSYHWVTVCESTIRLRLIFLRGFCTHNFHSQSSHPPLLWWLLESLESHSCTQGLLVLFSNDDVEGSDHHSFHLDSATKDLGGQDPVSREKGMHAKPQKCESFRVAWVLWSVK